MYKVVALDLEGTLISNAVSQFPRPRLYQVLKFCQTYFERVVLFTSVSENRARVITQYLVESGNAPAWFEMIEYVNWHGQYKDLNFVSDVMPKQVLLIDDQEVYIHPEQKQNWIQVKEFEPPYNSKDDELCFLEAVLLSKLNDNLKD